MNELRRWSRAQVRLMHRTVFMPLRESNAIPSRLGECIGLLSRAEMSLRVLAIAEFQNH